MLAISPFYISFLIYYGSVGNGWHVLELFHFLSKIAGCGCDLSIFSHQLIEH